MLRPGVASPGGQVSVDVYEKIARKNVRVQGVWVSEPRHLYQALQVVQAQHTRFPLAAAVTHRYRIEDSQQALEAVARLETVKAVIAPAA